MPNILNVSVSGLTAQETINQCNQWLEEERGVCRVIMTPNPEILVHAHRDTQFRAVLQEADLLIPDGIGLQLAVRFESGEKIPERVTGVDLMVHLLAIAKEKGMTVGFIIRRGGLSTVGDIERAMRKRYPTIDFIVRYPDEGVDDLVPHLLFVGLGFPYQEQWCHEYRAQFSRTKLILTVGGGIDYLTNKQQRAPSVLRSLGVEWLWRLWKQPWRLKRIVTATIIFPWFVIMQRYATKP